MDIYFTLWVIIQYMVVYFMAQMVLLWPLGKISGWLFLCPVCHPRAHPFSPPIILPEVLIKDGCSHWLYLRMEEAD